MKAKIVCTYQHPIIESEDDHLISGLQMMGAELVGCGYNLKTGVRDIEFEYDLCVCSAEPTDSAARRDIPDRP